MLYFGRGEVIDAAAIKERVSVLDVMGNDKHLRRVASTNGGELAGPCPFCGGEDRFRVQPNAPGGGRWLCRGCTDGKWRDALAYVMRRDNLSFREACERLGDVQSFAHLATTTTPQNGKHGSHEPPSAAWQERARAFLGYCQAQLWSDVGREGREYLQRRGIADDTARRWGLGWNPRRLQDSAGRWGLEGEPVHLARGVVIPHLAGDRIWALKIRLVPTVTFRDGKALKYTGPRGGKACLFSADFIREDGRPLVLAEGEFDAMLLSQEAGDLVDVATLGGVTTGLDLATWGTYLLSKSTVLVAYHADAPGAKGAGRIEAMTARARRVRVPQVERHHKDITDFHLAGGHLRDWIQFELARLGIVELQAPQVEQRLTMIWPADSRVPTVVGQWQRLEDGRIQASYGRAELAEALWVADAIGAAHSTGRMTGGL
jgi:hypothetical protein